MQNRIENNTKEEEEKQSIMTDADEVKEMERIFNCFDANGDGKISSAELSKALEKLGQASPSDIQHMMAEIDADKDGFIDFKEFSDFYKVNKGLMKDIAKVF